MEQIIRVKDQFYILASTSLADAKSRVLKHGETFAIFDRHGDIRPFGFEDHGVYFEGTRFLSRLDVNFEGQNPLLLSSTVKEDNDVLVVDLMNPDFPAEDGIIQRGTVHASRSIFLYKSSCFERFLISNYGLGPVSFSFSVLFAADYSDIFEVRGMKRKARGEMLEPVVEMNRVVLRYKGLDERVRRTRIEFSPAPDRISPEEISFLVNLAPQQKAAFYFTVSCEYEDEPVESRSYEQAFLEVQTQFLKNQMECTQVETSNEKFNHWINRSKADINMMLTESPYGMYPFAGIPWFSTYFGRDGIITALETLWLYPEISRGVLTFLAAFQAEELIPEQDAEPGKIIHEIRRGEMAVLKEIPFGRYYGTIDATPLFIVLAGYYYERTGDRDFIQQLWPNIERALDWIDHYGDSDGDGFVEYKQRSDGGLSNQGWKDSEDSVFHSDGRFAHAPIALCEVQGYVYDAKRKAAGLAVMLGKKQRAEKLEKEAEKLKQSFHRDFWSDDLGMYAIALDGDKKPCFVRSSNAGHSLFSGIAGEAQAKIIAQTMVTQPFFTGWGIRTIAGTEPRYNPMSYHNGSIWPHDNALIAFGMSRYGMKEAALKVLTGLFEAGSFIDLQRLPELFCGFDRRPGEGPTLYPVACDPQAWAAGAVFLLIQACLGLRIAASENKIYFHQPQMPAFLKQIHIKNLKVDSASIDLVAHRYDQDVSISVTRRLGYIEVVTLK